MRRLGLRRLRRGEVVARPARKEELLVNADAGPITRAGSQVKATVVEAVRRIVHQFYIRPLLDFRVVVHELGETDQDKEGERPFVSEASLGVLRLLSTLHARGALC